jgi:hypothetical protein
MAKGVRTQAGRLEGEAVEGLLSRPGLHAQQRCFDLNGIVEQIPRCTDSKRVTCGRGSQELDNSAMDSDVDTSRHGGDGKTILGHKRRESNAELN